MSDPIPLPDGFSVGHWSDPEGLTGCTVVIPPSRTRGGVWVQGGGPGTRETDTLNPLSRSEEASAILLTGGSAFGLAAADGVVRWLEEQGRGFDTDVARVPIVPAAVLFDLGIGDASVRPGPDQGYAACRAASEAVPEGNVGAGTGATVAKLRGIEGAVKGGLGSVAHRVGDLVVAALATVNALGEILEEDGSVLAGSRLPESPDTAAGGSEAAPGQTAFGTNTTLVVVATNARLSKERAHLLAGAAHEGITAAVRPSHTRHDGDTVFTLATGGSDAAQRDVERMAASAVAEAIRRGVRAAAGVPGAPAAR